MSALIKGSLSNPHFIMKKAVKLTEELYRKCSVAEKSFYDQNIRIKVEDTEQLRFDTVGQENEL